MDSPELKYLKAMQKVNQKFYMHATLEFAFLQAVVAALADIVKADVAKREDLTPAEIEAAFLKKLRNIINDGEHVLSRRCAA